MRELKLVCRHDPRDKSTWVVVDEAVFVETRLLLVGLNHACDTPASVVAGVFGALYDHPPHGLQDGDTIVSLPTKVNCYHRWDERFGSFTVPAMRFRVDGVHVVLEDPPYAWVQEKLRREEQD